MKIRTKSTMLALVFLAGLLSAPAVGFAAQEENALDGLKSIKAIIDFRLGKIGTWFSAELADGSYLSPFSHQTIVRKYKARRG